MNWHAAGTLGGTRVKQGGIFETVTKRVVSTLRGLPENPASALSRLLVGRIVEFCPLIMSYVLPGKPSLGSSTFFHKHEFIEIVGATVAPT